MKIMILVILIGSVSFLAGCNESRRVFDSEISAIRDQTKVLEKIEKHLEKIAEKEVK